jgi:hypothetical protein
MDDEQCNGNRGNDHHRAPKLSGNGAVAIRPTGLSFVGLVAHHKDSIRDDGKRGCGLIRFAMT